MYSLEISYSKPIPPIVEGDEPSTEWKSITVVAPSFARAIEWFDANHPGCELRVICVNGDGKLAVQL